jgi:TolB-like protein/tetratricopeptide (TPR) repeat protein
MLTNDHFPSGSPNPHSNADQLQTRLDSWKEIASYLKRSEKTVRRWEETEGLPVHRLLHEKGSSVYAYPDELRSWWESRKLRDAVVAKLPNGQAGPSGTDIAIAEAPPTEPKVSSLLLHPTSDPDSVETATTPGRRAKPFEKRSVILVVSVVLVLLGLVVVIVAIKFRQATLQRSSVVRIHSLAVLPFENLSGDTEQEYFADGMTAELITELAKLSSVRVISRTSVMQYKHFRKPLAEIARELNVDAVVEGEVLRSQNRVRVTAQLIYAAEDRHIWAETYDRDLRDVVDLQSDVAQSIAKAIGAKVMSAEASRGAPVRRVDPEAYEAYLKGRFFFEKRTTEGINKAVDYFQKAIRIDRQFAKAYAGLAKTYDLLGAYEILPSGEVFPKAREAADKALQLDDTLSEAYTARGFASTMYDWDWSAAEQDFQRAIALNTNDATAHHWYAEYLLGVGRAERAIAELENARELDPLSLPINGTLGRAYRDVRRYGDSTVQCRKTIDLDPDFALGHWCLGLADVAEKRYTEAVSEMQLAHELGTSPVYTWGLGYAYAASGDRIRARSMIAMLKRGANGNYAPAYFIASIHGALADKDLAFTWLQRAYAERDPWITYLLFDPFMDPLRSDARFDVLVHKVGLL